MRAIFLTRPTNIGSALIRAREGSTASHCALVLNDGSVIESVFPKVRIHTAEKWQAHCKVKNIITLADLSLNLSKEEAAETWAKSQIGKWYGLLGILGFLVWRDLNSDKTPYCSQLVVGAEMAGGYTPQDPQLKRWGIAIVREVSNLLSK